MKKNEDWKRKLKNEDWNGKLTATITLPDAKNNSPAISISTVVSAPTAGCETHAKKWRTTSSYNLWKKKKDDNRIQEKQKHVSQLRSNKSAIEEYVVIKRSPVHALDYLHGDLDSILILRKKI